MPPPTLESRFVGCLVGCAVGDALGAPHEGLWSRDIPGRDVLLAGFEEVEGYPLGQYTDDTQLTLATIESIVRREGVDPADVARSIAELWRTSSVVGPGGACTEAALRFLKTGDWRTCGASPGRAGNGTAMRAAALGPHYVFDPDRLPDETADLFRITHQDSRSVAGGVAVAEAARLFAVGDDDGPEPFCRAVAAAARRFDQSFADLIESIPALLLRNPLEAAEIVARAGSATAEFPRPIISPFVIPTVLASLWIVLLRPTSWPDAVAGAIRLGGDVDTLGAIVGALMGARLGIEAIPSHLADGVLDSARLKKTARLHHALVAARGAAGRGTV